MKEADQILIFTFLYIFLIDIQPIVAQNNGLLNLSFTEIDSLEFIGIKNEYPGFLIKDSTKYSIPDSSFSLVIGNIKEQFNCSRTCYYYEGFLPPLNSYVVTHCGMLTCETYLINRTTGIRDFLFTPFDSHAEAPILSKVQKKMLVFASNVFARESFISIYERSSDLENFNLQSFKSLMIDTWKIHDAVWIDSVTFALIVYDKYGGMTGNELINARYLSVKIE